MAMSKGIDLLILTSARVGAKPKYYPAHVGKNGPVNQKLEFPLYSNKRLGNGSEKKSTYNMVAWGKLADSLAQTLHVGKELAVVGDPGTYEKRHWNSDGTARTDAAGQQLVSKGTNFTILKFAYGDDSQRQIDQEIMDGTRPQFYNVRGHADYEKYRNILKAQKGQRVPWNGQPGDFGNAEVRIPAGMQVDFSQYPHLGYGGQNTPQPQQQQQMPNPAAGMQQQQQMPAGVDPATLAAVVAAMQAQGNGQVPMPNPAAGMPTPPAVGGNSGPAF